MPSESAQERARLERLLEEVQAARARAEAAERRAVFLAEATSVLAASLDFEATFGALVRLIIPELADWCAVDVLEEGGALRRVAIAHSDPEKVAAAWDLEKLYPRDAGADAGIARIIRWGRPQLLEQVPDELVQAVARDERHLQMLRAAGLRSGMVVPLMARGRPLGAISFAMAESGRTFGKADLEHAQNLADRAALAIDNARLYDEAQLASRSKDNFLATLSHELRTPLNAIVGWVQLLRAGNLDAEETRRALDTIARNAEAQNRMVGDILDTSRIISGRLSMSTRATDLAGIVATALDTVRPAAQARAISLRGLADPQPCMVLGDPERLQQVVWNLLVNAIKFTPRGGAVAVDLSHDAGYGEVRVRDTGEGIEPSFLPHVFDRFRHAQSPARRSHGGLGLGLAIARHLVEMHGGTIHAESAGPGQGATFRIRLPLLSGESRAAESRPSMVRAAPPALQGLRVLVVDDDADSREVAQSVLERQGASVMAVSSAAEAFDRVQAGEFDVLLSDIEMPEEDGYELLRRIRGLPEARGGRIPAAAFTAYARFEDRVRALMAGYQLHLPKPIQPEDLTSAVAVLAGRR